MLNQAKYLEKHVKIYKKYLNKFYPISFIRKMFFYLVKMFYKILYTFSIKKINTTKCDVLFLYGYAEEKNRTKKLRDILVSKGLNVRYDFFSKKRFIKEKLNTNGISISLLTETIDANYLINKYLPKVIVTFSHNSIISPILKHNLRTIDGKLINIAHAVLGDSHGFSMFDFDYYFIFGESSYQNALKNSNRFGSTKLVKSGSIFLPESASNKTEFQDKKVLFFSTWLPDSVKDVLVENAKITIQWAKENPEYTLYIKLHHHENPSFINQLSQGTKNIFVLSKSTTMAEALSKVSLVITSWSNASIEAALANKPVIMVNVSNLPDKYLSIEKYFLKRCQSTHDMKRSIEEIYMNYSFYQKRCVDYSSFHYCQKSGVNEYISSCIDGIATNKIDFDFIDIQENFNGE